MYKSANNTAISHQVSPNILLAGPCDSCPVFGLTNVGPGICFATQRSVEALTKSCEHKRPCCFHFEALALCCSEVFFLPFALCCAELVELPALRARSSFVRRKPLCMYAFASLDRDATISQNGFCGFPKKASDFAVCGQGVGLQTTNTIRARALRLTSFKKTFT